MLTLHVTDGDAAASGLARSGLPGDVLTWRDVLHDGPVPNDDDRAAFRRTRAAFLAEGGWASADEVVVDFEHRDARLDEIGPGNEVVLWFEPDLYDQLQLMQTLSRFAARSPDQRPALSIVAADLYLGTLAPEKFAGLFATRRVIRDADIAHAMDAWRAYTSDSPLPLLAVTQRLDREVSARMYSENSEVRLPHLAGALRRALEEYPDSVHGLSRTERQICEALAPVDVTMSKLFRTAGHDAESWVWLGDLSFAWYVQRMSDCSTPLITHSNGTCVIAAQSGRDTRALWERTVRLTEFGHRVVRGKADAVAANGIDRWIGGVRLGRANDWRFDAKTATVVKR